MPIHEYACTKCFAACEKFKKMREEHDLECPECGKKTLQPLISMPKAIVKKGAEDPGETVRRITGVKKGVQFHDNPITGERVWLKGSKANRKKQIQQSYLSEKVPKHIREKATNMNNITIPNL